MVDEHGLATEQPTLAPETEVALEVSRRLPLLLAALGLMVVCCVACRRRMRRRDGRAAAAPVEWMPYRPHSGPAA